MKEIKEKIRALLTEMNKGAYEREELISLAMLSALSGESIFLLGLPGVGKSMVARRLKMAFKDAQSFEYLMSRFSIPDEIFGPVSIPMKESSTDIFLQRMSYFWMRYGKRDRQSRIHF